GATWRAGLPEIPGIRRQAFRRGFPEQVEVEGVGPFLRHARRLFAAAPVRHVTFSDIDEDAVGELARSRHLARLATLDLISAQLGDQALLDLLNARLSGLELGGTGRGEEGCRPRAACPPLGGLRPLWLSSADITAAGAGALAASPPRGSLTRLHLYNNAIADVGAQALTDSAAL